MDMATVSVIVPSYNKDAYIGETLDSVLSQDGVRVELIVVDDGSTDRSREVISSYRDQLRAYALDGNRGAAYARNLGARMATGEFLMFLDADDVLGPGTLAPLVEAIRDKTGYVAACPWRRLQQEGERWVPYSNGRGLDPPGGDPVRAWLGRWYIPPCAILWPRELFERHGGWDEELTASDDEELMIRVLLRGTRIAHATAGEAFYRYFKAGGTYSSTRDEHHARTRTASLGKLVRESAEQGLLPKYRTAFGMAYVRLAHTYVAPYPELRLQCLRAADDLLGSTLVSGSVAGRVIERLIGLEGKERIVIRLARHGLLRRAREPRAAVQPG